MSRPKKSCGEDAGFRAGNREDRQPNRDVSRLRVHHEPAGQYGQVAQSLGKNGDQISASTATYR
jgi:hypothetical protein